MTQRIQFQSRVGQDGVLSVQVPLGQEDADAEVRITIERVDAASAATDWHEFVRTTYGSCADLGLEEPLDLPLPPMDWTE